MNVKSLEFTLADINTNFASITVGKYFVVDGDLSLWQKITPDIAHRVGDWQRRSKDEFDDGRPLYAATTISIGYA